MNRLLLSGLAGFVLATPDLFAADAVEVAIADFRFTPATVTVKVGTTVRWVNREKRTSHSVLFTGAGGLESERLFPGETYARTFDRPGRHPYTCGPHPEMTGVVEVVE